MQKKKFMYVLNDNNILNLCIKVNNKFLAELLMDLAKTLPCGSFKVASQSDLNLSKISIEMQSIGRFKLNGKKLADYYLIPDE